MEKFLKIWYILNTIFTLINFASVEANDRALFSSQEEEKSQIIVSKVKLEKGSLKAKVEKESSSSDSNPFNFSM